MDNLDPVRRQHGPLDEGTLERLQAVFASSEWLQAAEMLEARLADPRCRRAALKLSGGGMAKLEEAIALGESDFRDLLMAAGFGSDVYAHYRWHPGSGPRSLCDLAQQFQHLMRSMAAPSTLWNFRTEPPERSGVHAELHADTYARVVTEGGVETERHTTTDAEELLYWLVCDAALELATAMSAPDRPPADERRRLVFERQVQLLGRVSYPWRARRRKEIAQLLR